MCGAHIVEFAIKTVAYMWAHTLLVVMADSESVSYVWVVCVRAFVHVNGACCFVERAMTTKCYAVESARRARAWRGHPHGNSCQHVVHVPDSNLATILTPTN